MGIQVSSAEHQIQLDFPSTTPDSAILYHPSQIFASKNDK